MELGPDSIREVSSFQGVLIREVPLQLHLPKADTVVHDIMIHNFLQLSFHKANQAAR